METHENDMSLAAQQGISQNQDHVINGLRVLAKILARFHAKQYRITNIELESQKQGEKDEDHEDLA